MNSDATEAALGLLGLSPLNAPPSQPQPSSSTVGGISGIDRMSNGLHNLHSPALPPSLVPLKRKQPSPGLSSTTGGVSLTITAAANTSTESLSVESTARHGFNLPSSSSTTTAMTSTDPLQNVQTGSKTALQRRQQPYSPHIMTSFPSSTSPPLVSPSVSPHPQALQQHRRSPSRQHEPQPPPPADSDAISCICGLTYDDGFSIACDDCSRWCHAACFGIMEGGDVPEEWKCWVCDPELGRKVDRERAVKVQKGRVRALKGRGGGMGGIGAAEGGASGSGANSGAGEGAIVSMAKPVSRRKTSPGAERKQRRGSAVATAVDSTGSVSSKKRRRVSMLPPSSAQPPDPSSSSHAVSRPSHASSARISHPPASAPVHADANNNHRDLDQATSASAGPSVFPPDHYPHPSTHAYLLRVARAWRGVTALNPPSPLNPPKTYVDGQLGWTRVDSQGYSDRYGYSMSPLDNTTPVMLNGAVEDVVLPRTVLKMDAASAYSHPEPSPNMHSDSTPHLHSYSSYSSPYSYTSPYSLRPPSPRLHVASSIPRPHPTPVCNPKPPDPTRSNLDERTIPAATLLTPYTASIMPSSAYLADPLNGYAHLGMGKPQVRLVGGGWEVGVDARQAGFESESGGKDRGRGSEAGEETIGKGRWARCGCWPNAVMRPVICRGSKGKGGKMGRAEDKGPGRKHGAGCAESGSAPGEELGNMVVDEGDETDCSGNPKNHSFPSNSQDPPDPHTSTPESDTDAATLSFALFALRDLRADEEIVLGWEWDDGHAVHMLPALMESPGIFGPAHLSQLRAQFTSILHALSSTFTTCACGSSTRDCAVRLMERVVEGRWPWPGGEISPSGSDCGSESISESDCTSSECCGDVDTPERKIHGISKRKRRKVHAKRKKVVDLGPLVGVKRGFRTREKAPMSGGWCGVEVVPSSLVPFPNVRRDEVSDEQEKNKGRTNVSTKGRTRDHHTYGDGDQLANGSGTTDCSTSCPTKGHDRVAGAFVDPPSVQTVLPPRMRKPWMQPPVSSRPSQRVQRQSFSGSYAQRQHHESAEDDAGWSGRSPQAMDVESPLSSSVVAVHKSGKLEQRGHGIVPTGGDGVEDKNLDGQDTDFDTETEGEGMEDTQQMPPPPMPAALDPTTVSSRTHARRRSTSPRLIATKNGAPHVTTSLVPSRTPTPASAALRKSSHVTGQVSSSGFSAHSPKNSAEHTSHMDQSLDSSLNTPSRATQSHNLPHLPLHPRPLVQNQPPTPSTPFSKLSLFSPDVSLSSSQTSTLVGSEPGSTEVQAYQDAKSSLISLHEPSKPLHVQPPHYTEATTSAPVPVIRTNSPKPERRSDLPLATAPTDSRQPARADPYRVRFASPEVLNGLPPLMLRTEDSSCINTQDVDIDIDVVGESNDGEHLPLTASRKDGESEAMDVDQDPNEEEVIDVVGDDPNVSSTDTSWAEDASPAAKGGSSNGQKPAVPLTSPSPVIDVVGDDPNVPSTDITIVSWAEECYAPPTAKDGSSNGQRSAVPLTSSPVPEAQPPRPREPSPPPPKVKMSLKDFARRKKKQREEEMAAKALASPASPLSAAGSLPSPNVLEGELGSESGNTAAGISRVERVDDNVTNHRERGPIAPADSREMIEVDSEATTDVEKGMKDKVNAVDEAGAPPHHPQANDNCEMTAGNLSAQPAAPAKESYTPPQPLVPLLCAPDGTTIEARTDSQTDGAPVTLKAKVEIMEATMPSGLVGIDERVHEVVSLAPEPPPPPLVIQKINDVDVGENREAIPSTSTSVTTSSTGSRSTSTPTSTSPNHSTPYPRSYPASLPPQQSNKPPLSRHISHEDGEILTATPSKTYTPRSHTPPTQPRSFSSSVTHTSSVAPSIPRRPPQPPLSRPPSSNASGPGSNSGVAPNGLSRPLPSGPRALRGSTNQPTYPLTYAPSTRPYLGSQYIPRGPSADRDRTDWDRDRQWAAPSRSRGRAGSNGWGR